VVGGEVGGEMTAPSKSAAIAAQYFAEHPEAKADVIKAYYAYHAPHFRLEPKGHNFPSGSRESQCVWCGRSREMVRHDQLPPVCLERPELREVADVIRAEEEKAFALLARARTDVPKLVARLGMSGETLAVLHHTHGHDPETVAALVPVPPQMLADYHAAMEAERERSLRRRKKKILT
jgi:ribosomal protein S14